MQQRGEYPGWFLWLWERGPGLFLLGMLLFLAVVLGSVVYLDRHLSAIEDRLARTPDRSYQPPDLDALAAPDVEFSELGVRRTMYAPVYSHIYHNGGAPYPLETTLSIRNVDSQRAIYVARVDYFDTSGSLVKSHLDRVIALAPLQTIEFLVERRDGSGGSGANFLVTWGTNGQAAPPLVETVMVGALGSQGVCFARPAAIAPQAGDSPNEPAAR